MATAMASLSPCLKGGVAPLRARHLAARATISSAKALRAKKAGTAVHCARAPMNIRSESMIESMDREYKEDSRKFRRNVYDAELWKRHRSSGRYLRHISTMFASSNIKGQFPVVAFFAGAAFVYCYINNYAPESLHFTLSATPFNVTASALSLLLVFRTNASYDRWWEARKIWGALLNRSRDFVRQGLTWFDDGDMQLKAQLTRYMIAFAVALKVHLRPSEENMREELAPILEPEELELALSKVHVPNHLLRMMSAIVAKADLPTPYTTAMDMNITAFEDDLGKCERIFKTPIPLAYTRMTSRILVTWLLLFPLALYKDAGWATIPAEAFIAFLLLGIEEVGVQIEEPFSILSCEGICGSVKDNCTAMYETHQADRGVIQKSVVGGPRKEYIPAVRAEAPAAAAPAPPPPSQPAAGRTSSDWWVS